MAKLLPPKNGMTVRMYRQGHGDCFLLAFPRDGSDEPVYVLIDCGYKPGSQRFVHGKSIGKVVEHVGLSTGNRLDLVVITHEHQDHVNGIWKKRNPYFRDFDIEEAWFAWTESPSDPLAIELRERHRDQLLGLIEARHQLQLAGDDDVPIDPAVKNRLDGLLALEVGGARDRFDRNAMVLAASDPEKSTNKQAMKLIKDKARAHRGPKCLDPGKAPRSVPGTAGVLAYVLGPPRDENLLTDEDPVGAEGFDTNGGGSHGLSFAAAAVAAASADQAPKAPFRDKYVIAAESAFTTTPDARLSPRGFFSRYYGQQGDGVDRSNNKEVPSNAYWRRIDEEWLYSAESLALKLNTGINNTSLVLAFELPRSKKVLLFAGDAQRGNWLSWSQCEWNDGDTDKARDLLGRTVLYKVGHHGSHNATLKGTDSDDYANLSWMGHGEHAGEFTAMITAVTEWAMTKNSPPWRHPLPSIRAELDRKTQGRVFQTDQDQPTKPDDVTDAEWSKFTARMKCTQMYFDYQILDE